MWVQNKMGTRPETALAQRSRRCFQNFWVTTGRLNFLWSNVTVNNEHTCNFLFMQFLPGPKRSEEYREVRGFLLGMRQPRQGLPVERRKAMTSLHLK